MGPDPKDLLAEVRHPLDRLATFLRVIDARLSDRVKANDLHVSSAKDLRTEFVRRLQQVLVRHGLEDGLGSNSLIVHVLLRLDQKESEDAGIDESRRKDAAAEVRKAVKPAKSG